MRRLAIIVSVIGLGACGESQLAQRAALHCQTIEAELRTLAASQSGNAKVLPHYRDIDFCLSIREPDRQAASAASQTASLQLDALVSRLGTPEGRALLTSLADLLAAARARPLID